MSKAIFNWRLLLLLILILPTSSCFYGGGRIDADGFAGRTDPKKTGFGYFYFFGSAVDGSPELRAVVRRTAESTERVSLTDNDVVLETYDESRYQLFNSYLLVVDSHAGILLTEKPNPATFVVGLVCRSTDSSQAPLELAILISADQSRLAALYSGEAPMQQFGVTRNGSSELGYSSAVFSSEKADRTGAPQTQETPGTTHEMNFTSSEHGTKPLTCLIPSQFP